MMCPWAARIGDRQSLRPVSNALKDHVRPPGRLHRLTRAAPALVSALWTPARGRQLRSEGTNHKRSQSERTKNKRLAWSVLTLGLWDPFIHSFIDSFQLISLFTTPFPCLPMPWPRPSLSLLHQIKIDSGFLGLGGPGPLQTHAQRAGLDRGGSTETDRGKERSLRREHRNPQGDDARQWKSWRRRGGWTPRTLCAPRSTSRYHGRGAPSLCTPDQGKSVSSLYLSTAARTPRLCSTSCALLRRIWTTAARAAVPRKEAKCLS